MKKKKQQRKVRVTKADAAVMKKKRGPKTRIPGEKGKPRMMRFADSEWNAIHEVASSHSLTLAALVRECLGLGVGDGGSAAFFRNSIAASAAKAQGVGA